MGQFKVMDYICNAENDLITIRKNDTDFLGFPVSFSVNGIESDVCLAESGDKPS